MWAAITALQHVVDEHRRKLAELDSMVVQLTKENKVLRKQMNYLSNYT